MVVGFVTPVTRMPPVAEEAKGGKTVSLAGKLIVGAMPTTVKGGREFLPDGNEVSGLVAAGSKYISGLALKKRFLDDPFGKKSNPTMGQLLLWSDTQSKARCYGRQLVSGKNFSSWKQKTNIAFKWMRDHESEVLALWEKHKDPNSPDSNTLGKGMSSKHTLVQCLAHGPAIIDIMSIKKFRAIQFPTGGKPKAAGTRARAHALVASQSKKIVGHCLRFWCEHLNIAKYTVVQGSYMAMAQKAYEHFNLSVASMDFLVGLLDAQSNKATMLSNVGLPRDCLAKYTDLLVERTANILANKGSVKTLEANLMLDKIQSDTMRGPIGDFCRKVATNINARPSLPGVSIEEHTRTVFANTDSIKNHKVIFELPLTSPKNAELQAKMEKDVGLFRKAAVTNDTMRYLGKYMQDSGPFMKLAKMVKERKAAEEKQIICAATTELIRNGLMEAVNDLNSTGGEEATAARFSLNNSATVQAITKIVLANAREMIQAEIAQEKASPAPVGPSGLKPRGYKESMEYVNVLQPVPPVIMDLTKESGADPKTMIEHAMQMLGAYGTVTEIGQQQSMPTTGMSQMTGMTNTTQYAPPQQQQQQQPLQQQPLQQQPLQQQPLQQQPQKSPYQQPQRIVPANNAVHSNAYQQAAAAA